MFVTYDLLQNSNTSKRRFLVRRAKEVIISGEVIGWKVNEFESQSGDPLPRVEIIFRENSDLPTMKQLIEVPALAKNVQFHLASVPSEYLSAIKALNI